MLYTCSHYFPHLLFLIVQFILLWLDLLIKVASCSINIWKTFFAFSLRSPLSSFFFFFLMNLFYFILFVFMIICFFFKKFVYFNWRLIVLQYCGVFFHTLTWINHGCTCVAHPEPATHLPPHPISQGHPNQTWTGDLFHIW